MIFDPALDSRKTWVIVEPKVFLCVFLPEKVVNALISNVIEFLDLRYQYAVAETVCDEQILLRVGSIRSG